MIQFKPSIGPESSPKYICHVDTKNGKIENEVDKLTVELIKKIAIENGCSVIARGRNPNRKDVADNNGISKFSMRYSVPLKHSTTFALYLNKENPIVSNLRQIAIAVSK